MTICIAAMHDFSYNQDGSDLGKAVIVATDRMLTLENLAMEYESPLQKRAILSSTCMLLPAGSIVVHSELIARFKKAIPSPDDVTIYDKAHKYGEIHRSYLAECAEQAVLSRLKMDLPTFYAMQRSMDAQEVANLSTEIRDYQAGISAQAIITGCDKNESAHIFHVDQQGIVHCFDDVGSCCIGIGSSHAASQLAQQGHGNVVPFYPTLVMAYSAKKAAETAPGIGPKTDMAVVSRDGVHPIDPLTFKNLETQYSRLRKNIKRQEQNLVQLLMKAQAKTHGWPWPPTVVGPTT